jgi:hypothetical protein
MITDADGLLAARFAATRDDHDDGDWNDVLRRRQPRRLHRRRTLLIAVAVVAVAVPSAIAFGGAIRDLFFGKPAPSIVKRVFVQHNEMAQLMQKWQKKHGAHFPPMPHVDATKAHGVLAVKTRDGLLFLWAAPAGGGRECWFIDFAADQFNHKRAVGGGSCDSPTPTTTKIHWSYGGSAAHPMLRVLSGRLSVPAAAVLVTTGPTKPHRVSVVDRYFLAAFPRSTKTPAKITAIDARGHVVASWAR